MRYANVFYCVFFFKLIINYNYSIIKTEPAFIANGQVN